MGGVTHEGCLLVGEVKCPSIKGGKYRLRARACTPSKWLRRCDAWGWVLKKTAKKYRVWGALVRARALLRDGENLGRWSGSCGRTIVPAWLFEREPPPRWVGLGIEFCERYVIARRWGGGSLSNRQLGRGVGFLPTAASLWDLLWAKSFGPRLGPFFSTVVVRWVWWLVDDRHSLRAPRCGGAKRCG